MPSFVRGWTLAALLIWFGFESWLIFREARSTGDSLREDHDQGTRWFVFSSVLLGGVVAWLASDLEVGSFRLVNNEVFGISVMMLGIVFRWWAVISLGRYFTLPVTVQRDQRLIDRGPYRILRHPSYAGTLLTSLGWGIAMGNLLSLLVALLIPLPAFVRRISVEERALTNSLGESYQTYKQRTKRLVPGIW